MASLKRSEIERTERQSASLKRELRLPDLVLLQVLLIVGLPWIGYAAKLGGSHVVLWMGGLARFFFPPGGAGASSRRAAAAARRRYLSMGEDRALAVRGVSVGVELLVLPDPDVCHQWIAGGQQPVLPAGAGRRLDDQLQAADPGVERGVFRDCAVGQRARAASGALDHLRRRGAGDRALRADYRPPGAAPVARRAAGAAHRDAGLPRPDPDDREPVQQDRLQRAERL